MPRAALGSPQLGRSGLGSLWWVPVAPVPVEGGQCRAGEPPTPAGVQYRGVPNPAPVVASLGRFWHPLPPAEEEEEEAAFPALSC